MDGALRSMAKQYKGIKQTSIEKGKAYKEIGKMLEDWMPRRGFESLECFQVYIESDRTILPFAGGWLDQPEWVREDFRLFKKILDYHILDLDQPSRDTHSGMEF